MSALEAAIEELKTLPSSEQEEAANFIHSLKQVAKSKKNVVLDRTFGCLSPEEGQQWEQAIEEGIKIEDQEHGSW